MHQFQYASKQHEWIEKKTIAVILSFGRQVTKHTHTHSLQDHCATDNTKDFAGFTLFLFFFSSSVGFSLWTEFNLNTVFGNFSGNFPIVFSIELCKRIDCIGCYIVFFLHWTYLHFLSASPIKWLKAIIRRHRVEKKNYQKRTTTTITCIYVKWFWIVKKATTSTTKQRNKRTSERKKWVWVETERTQNVLAMFARHQNEKKWNK